MTTSPDVCSFKSQIYIIYYIYDIFPILICSTSEDHTSTLHPAVGHHTMKDRALVAKREAALRQASLSCAQGLEVLWRLWTNVWEQLRKEGEQSKRHTYLL